MIIQHNMRERILNAANYLVAQGIEKPTNDQVRERLGGGSLSHISPVMREWRNERRKSIDTAIEMPEELKKSIQLALGQIWGTASRLAGEKTEAIKAQADSDLSEVKEELSSALAEIAKLEAELEKVSGQAERQYVELAGLREELRDLRIDNEKMAIAKATLETGMKDRQSQIDTLRTDLQESRQENKTLQQELIDLVRKRNTGD